MKNLSGLLVVIGLLLSGLRFGDDPDRGTSRC